MATEDIDIPTWVYFNNVLFDGHTFSGYVCGRPISYNMILFMNMIEFHFKITVLTQSS